MFAYCNSNPIVYSDPSGFCRCVGPNDIKIIDCGSFACKLSTSYRYYADSPQYADSCAGVLGAHLGVQLNDWIYELEFFEDWVGTFSVGATAGCMGGFGGTISVALAFDSNGNLGLLITPAIGAGIYASGVAGSATATNAPGIEELRGISKQFGGAVVLGGYEHSWFDGAVTSNPYQGHSIIVGPVGPVPAEMHYTLGYSLLIPFGNVRRE